METALPNDTILGNLDTEELRLSKIHYDEKLVTELAKALARYSFAQRQRLFFRARVGNVT